MARKRRHIEHHAGELNLTAMIDVAFQLLNFFLIAAHPKDVFTNLDIFRPATEERPQNVEVEPPQMLEIMVYSDGYIVQKHAVELAELDRQLTKLSANSKNVSVVIKCTGDSPHVGLVNVLDLCAKAGFTKLAVFSL